MKFRRSDIEDVFTLTPLQRGMLVHAAGGVHTFHERTVTSLDGALNLTAFQQAWQAVVDRHPALRTAFVWRDVTAPHQIVLRRVAFQVQHADWLRLDDETQERHIRRLIRGAEGGALDRPPLMSVTLVRAAARRLHLIWTISHLVTDAFSFSIILDDLLGRYRSALAGRPWDTRKGPSFREYVAWLKRQDTPSALRAWESQIASYAEGKPGSRGAPKMPLAVAPAVRTSRAATRRMTLSSELTAGLQAFAARHDTRLFAIHLGALALTQQALTQSASPVIAVVTSCRALPVARLDAMVGLVMNSVPVPIAIDESKPLGRWLQKLADDVRRLLAFEHVPFQRLHEACAARGLQCEIAFNFLNVNQRPPRGPGFDVTNYRQLLNSNFPIGVNVIPGRETEIEVSYQTSVVGGERIEQLLRQWRDVLALLPTGEPTVGAIVRMVSSAAAAARAADVAKRRRETLPSWMA